MDLAIGPDGQVATAAGYSGVVIWDHAESVWDGAAPPTPTKIPVDEWTRAVAYNNELVAVVSTDSDVGFVSLWETGSSCATTPSPCRVARHQISDDIRSMAFDSTGERLAVGNKSGEVELWDISKPDAISSISRWNAGEKEITELAFSPTADVLVTGNDDGTLRLWALGKTPTSVGQPIEGHVGGVSALAFSVDGRTFASGGFDQKVVFWAIDLEASEPVKRLWEGYQSNTILAVAFSPSGIAAAGDGDGGTCLYDVTGHGVIGENSACLTAHASASNLGGTEALMFLPNGNLLTAGADNPIVEWDSILWDSDQPLDEAVCRFAGRDLTADEWNLAFAGTTLENKMHATCPKASP